jgi:hypothetical protein
MSDCLQQPKIVKVRKQHVCQGCGIKINIGESCTVSKVADGGEVYSFYECESCREFYDKNCAGCSDFDYCIGENYFIGSIKKCKDELEEE